MNKHILCLSLAKKLLAFSLAILTSLAITNVSDADVVIFDATTSNTTGVNNNGAGTLTGATPNLIVTNAGVANNMGGFASTDDINTLLGRSLTVDDTVTMSVTIDSMTVGNLRGNGVEFGLADTAGFRPGTNNLLLGQAGSNSGSDVRFIGSFQDDGTLDFNSNQGAVIDGLSMTLTANSAGYSFFLEDILVAGSTNPLYTNLDTTATISGTFAGTEFLDHFSTGHFYVAVQQQTAGAAMVVDYSSATISVASAIPEPGSLALLCVGVAGICVKRRRV